jgi:hypothetical protein
MIAVLHDSANSFIVRPAENDLKSNGFLDNYSMKAKREQVNDKLIVLKLFTSNYTRDLMTLYEYSYTYSIY